MKKPSSNTTDSFVMNAVQEYVDELKSVQAEIDTLPQTSHSPAVGHLFQHLRSFFTVSKHD